MELRADGKTPQDERRKQRQVAVACVASAPAIAGEHGKPDERAEPRGSACVAFAVQASQVVNEAGAGENTERKAPKALHR